MKHKRGGGASSVGGSQWSRRAGAGSGLPAVRKQAPVVLGAVGAAQQPELRSFIAWVSDAAQRMVSASGKEGQLGWGLLLASARECVDALCRTDSVECAASGVPGLIG